MHNSRTFRKFHEHIWTQGTKLDGMMVFNCCFVVALPPERPLARRRENCAEERDAVGLFCIELLHEHVLHVIKILEFINPRCC